MLLVSKRGRHEGDCGGKLRLNFGLFYSFKIMLKLIGLLWCIIIGLLITALRPVVLRINYEANNPLE